MRSSKVKKKKGKMQLKRIHKKVTQSPSISIKSSHKEEKWKNIN